MKKLRKGVYLMKTNFRKGFTEVVNDYKNIPRYLAIKQAFEQKKGLNRSRTENDFYWVKFVY